MNTFVIEIWDDECPKCTFYTVRLEEPRSAQNETDKFFLKYETQEEYKEEINELL